MQTDLSHLLVSVLSHLSILQAAPIISLGKKANIVLIIAMMVLSTIKTQFIIFSARLISLPNNFRWNARGRIIQMEKHATEPSSVIIRSKDGKMMAMTTKVAKMKIRNRNLNMPRVRPDVPSKADEAASDRLSRPKTISNVEIIGLALSGIFVSGMMAIQIAMNTDMALGYPCVRKMLLVISSRTQSPNMRIPAHAIPRSSKKVKMYVILTPLRYLYGWRMSR
jgi:hypothetical protein